MRDLAQLSLRTISPASLNYRPPSPAPQQRPQHPQHPWRGPQQQHGAPQPQQHHPAQRHSASMQDKLHAVQRRLDECRANHASLAAGPLAEHVWDPAARRV